MFLLHIPLWISLQRWKIRLVQLNDPEYLDFYTPPRDVAGYLWLLFPVGKLVLCLWPTQIFCCVPHLMITLETKLEFGIEACQDVHCFLSRRSFCPLSLPCTCWSTQRILVLLEQLEDLSDSREKYCVVTDQDDSLSPLLSPAISCDPGPSLYLLTESCHSPSQSCRHGTCKTGTIILHLPKLFVFYSLLSISSYPCPKLPISLLLSTLRSDVSQQVMPIKQILTLPHERFMNLPRPHQHSLGSAITNLCLTVAITPHLVLLNHVTTLKSIPRSDYGPRGADQGWLWGHGCVHSPCTRWNTKLRFFTFTGDTKKMSHLTRQASRPSSAGSSLGSLSWLYIPRRSQWALNADPNNKMFQRDKENPCLLQRKQKNRHRVGERQLTCEKKYHILCLGV